MPDNQEAALMRRNAGRHFVCAVQKQFHHSGITPDRFAVFDRSRATRRDFAGKLHLARDDRFREITVTDEVRYDVNVVAFDEVKNLSKTRLLFPATTVHFSKNAAAT